MIHRNWPLAAIITIFILPALVAFTILHFAPIKLSSIEHGIFVEPKYINGLTSKWHILYFDDKQTTKMLKLHKALGVNQERVVIKLTSMDAINVNNTECMDIPIVDPHGYYILGYQPETNLSWVLKDLKRLLKYSHD